MEVQFAVLGGRCMCKDCGTLDPSIKPEFAAFSCHWRFALVSGCLESQGSPTARCTCTAMSCFLERQRVDVVDCQVLHLRRSHTNSISKQAFELLWRGHASAHRAQRRSPEKSCAQLDSAARSKILVRILESVQVPALLMTDANDMTLKELTKCLYLRHTACAGPHQMLQRAIWATCTDRPYFSIT